jgi:cyclopropane fatty-acyl-phospholipid synthase-like methyltransferase
VKAPTPESVARYYRDVTAEYEAYGGAALSWNYGIWEADVRTLQAAFQRGKEVMLHGLRIERSTRILDAGSGAGGFAIWCAQRFGCSVTGITICGEHVEVARRNAKDAGVEDHCEFRHMDMDALDFAAESFDVVTNQETYCCARDKRRYLKEVFRILAPGGAWSAIDYNVRPGKLSRAEAAELKRVLAGFHLPSLIPPPRVVAHLEAAGFVECSTSDVTALVLPSAEIVMRRCYEPLRFGRRFPRRRLHSPDAGREASIRGHYDAGMAYAIGLHTGLFEHASFRARKPTSAQAA